MKYNLSDPLQLEQFKNRVALAVKSGKGVYELKFCHPGRTLKQNAYLHLIISYFASQYGENVEFVKQNYFKLAANRDIFVREKDDPLAGHIRFLRSSSSLTTDEMRTAIERFRNWSSMTAGIYIPSSEEKDLLLNAEIEVSKNINFL